MLYILDLSTIVKEDMAIECANALTIEAIEAKNAMRGKRQKIRACEAKCKMLLQYCRTKGWVKPMAELKSSLDGLEQSLAEDSVSLWGI